MVKLGNELKLSGSDFCVTITMLHYQRANNSVMSLTKKIKEVNTSVEMGNEPEQIIYKGTSLFSSLKCSLYLQSIAWIVTCTKV